MEDTVGLFALAVAGQGFSTFPLLFLWCVAMQFGPGHLRISPGGGWKTGSWQLWAYLSHTFFLTSFCGTIVLLGQASWDFSHLKALMATELAAGLAASSIMALNLVFQTRRSFPSRAFQVGFLVVVILASASVGLLGLFSGLGQQVLESTLVGSVFGVIVYLPLTAMQRFQPRQRNDE